MRDQYEEYNDEKMAGPGRGPIWVVILILCGVGVAGLWYLQESDSGRDIVGYAGRSGVLRSPDDGALSGMTLHHVGGGSAIGTSGTDSEATESPATIRELATITGDNDGHELVGRKVSLHVPVQDQANESAFWVGEKDNRILVVLDRDRRNVVQRQDGAIAPDPIAPIHIGQQADIEGTIEKVPPREGRYSWGLSTADRKELEDRPIYIRANSLTTSDRGA